MVRIQQLKARSGRPSTADARTAYGPRRIRGQPSCAQLISTVLTKICLYFYCRGRAGRHWKSKRIGQRRRLQSCEQARAVSRRSRVPATVLVLRVLLLVLVLLVSLRAFAAVTIIRVIVITPAFRPILLLFLHLPLRKLLPLLLLLPLVVVAIVALARRRLTTLHCDEEADAHFSAHPAIQLVDGGRQVIHSPSATHRICSCARSRCHHHRCVVRHTRATARRSPDSGSDYCHDPHRCVGHRSHAFAR